MDWKYLRGSIMLKRQIAGVLFAGLALVLGGCTVIHVTTAADLSRARKSHSIVFGRFEWFENEKRLSIRPIVRYSSPQAAPGNLRDYDYGVRISKSGEFVLAVKAGDHLFYQVINRYYWGRNPAVKFRVPDNNGIYYLGTVRAQEAFGRDFRGVQSGCVQFSVRDDSESDYTAFTDKFGVSSTDIEKALMVHEPLPSKVEWTTCDIEWIRYDFEIPWTVYGED